MRLRHQSTATVQAMYAQEPDPNKFLPPPERTQPLVTRTQNIYEKSWDEKRPEFDTSVERYMYRGPGSDRLHLETLLKNNMVRHLWDWWLRCEQCNQYYPYQAVNVDHITPWKIIKTKLTEASQGAAKDAYNNVQNLQILCSVCNLSKSGSHEV